MGGRTKRRVAKEVNEDAEADDDLRGLEPQVVREQSAPVHEGRIGRDVGDELAVGVLGARPKQRQMGGESASEQHECCGQPLCCTHSPERRKLLREMLAMRAARMMKLSGEDRVSDRSVKSQRTTLKTHPVASDLCIYCARKSELSCCIAQMAKASPMP